MRGFEQREGEHYDGSSIASPVTNDVTIRVIMVIMIMAGWIGTLVDVKGAILNGHSDNREVIYAKFP